MEVGSARSHPGQLSYGALDAVSLPTGGADAFPIIIAQGRHEGQVLWLTASIHGAEYTGIQVIHQLLNADLLHDLRGTIVAIPTLNPAGLRTADRSAYYLRGQDPNRLFPGPKRTLQLSSEKVSPLELAYRRLFDHINQTADFLIDFHNYSLGTFPFAFRDPVFYSNERDRSGAQRLQTKVGEMLAAFGHTIINEFASAEYLQKNLHRTVSGAALNTARIPAFTVELGGYLTVDPGIVTAAVSGLRNVLRWAEMLSGPLETIRGIPVIKSNYQMRRVHHPYAPDSGIVRYLVKAGETVGIGDYVARLTDIYGRAIGSNDGLIRSELEGVVLAQLQGAIVYQNDPLLSMAIRDDSDLVVPFPPHMARL
jgi:uncharacterized protein